MNNNDPDMACGLGNYQPKKLGSCASVASFTAFYSISAVFTTSCQAYMASQITTLERYFGYSSAQSGFLLSCNDIGFLVSTLIISHQARKVHVPRVLGWSAIFFGIAALICSLAYFASLSVIKIQTSFNADDFSTIGNMSNATSNSDFFQGNARQMCDHDDNATAKEETVLFDDSITGIQQIKVGTPTAFTKVAFAIMVFGLILQGVAKAPRSSFLTVYIDDNGEKVKSAMYVGVIIGMSIFGPVLAFGLGGYFSQMYITLDEVEIKPYDPRWVGAWWLGFLLFGVIAICTGLPLMCFPRRLKPMDVWIQQKEETSAKEYIKGFVKDLFELLKNRLYISFLLVSCVSMIRVSGFISFTPKYLETQFFLPAWKSNIMFGVIGVLSGSAGSVIGGFIVSKFKFSPVTCLKSVIITEIVYHLITLSFFPIGCSNPNIVGYNYQGNSTCSESCYCDDEDYFPVCGSDGRNYFSPCHAGCDQQKGLGYANCACVGQNGTVTPGLCPSGCQMIYPYMIIFLISSLIGTFAILPGFIFVIRSVTDKQKALSVAFSSFVQSILGWLPGPVLFGKLIDTCCRKWSSSSFAKGACTMYDIEDFRYKRAMVEVLMGVFVIVCHSIILYLARKKTDWSIDVSSTDKGKESHEDDSVLVTYSYEVKASPSNRYSKRYNKLAENKQRPMI